MAYQFSYVTDAVNANGWGILFYNLKQLLKTVGWTVLSSSDGLTYFPASDGITHNGLGAAGMANALAWFRIRQPSGGVAPYAGVREIVFQLIDQEPPSMHLYAKVSQSGGFTGGAPSATRTPSSVDEHLWIGSGTDAVPVGFQFYSYNVPSYTKYYVCVNDAAPWEFYVHRLDTTSGTLAFGMDAVIQAPVSDPEPYVFYGCGDGGFDAKINILNQWTHVEINGVQTWVMASNGSWMNAGVVIAPAPGLNTNVYNSRVDAFPLAWAAPSAGAALGNGRDEWKRVAHFKGFSKGIDWSGSSLPAHKDRGTIISTNDRVFIAGAWWPWNGGVV